MKKQIISLLLCLLLCFALGTTALAAGGFDATVTVDRETEGYIYVTVSADDSILGTKRPTLTVPCNFENVDVVFAGVPVDYTLDKDNDQVSFTVTAKGTYVIVALHEVTFQNGSSKTTSAVRHGVAIIKPKEPSKTGYTFGGWYTDEACTTTYDFTTPVTADVTLYAKWVADPRTVTFDSKGGSTIAPVTVDYGTAVTAPNAPTRNGYTFDGWYIDSECKTAYDFSAPVTVDITLYAKWTYIPVYVPDTGSSNTGSSTVTNSDGSTTTTVTNKVTGTVTESTTYPNGVKSVTETAADGEITAAVTLPVSVDSTVVTILVADATPGTVAVIVHADGTEEIVQTSVITENGVALIVEDDVQLKIVDNSKDFTDVNGEWFQAAADFVSARGIITGNTTSTFSPDTDSSRTMIWTMLARLDGEDTSVGEAWWSVGKQWAIDNGISDGSLSDQSITREQLITMLYRYAQLKGIDVSVGEDTNILSYHDAFEVSEWAIPAMQWACGSGVVQGDGVNLMPAATASRAEVAQILMNFCNYLVL